jgi:prepilin-type N-terminal cleavage/methylation domain-containing protein
MKTRAFTLIELMIVVAIIAIIAAIAIPNLLEARKTGNETAAIGALRTLSSVQAQFRDGDKESDSVLDYASSLAELSNASLIDNVIASGVKSGYSFGVSGSTYEWLATATPVSSNTGTRNFIVCTNGVIRYSGSGPATCSSPAIE